MPFKRRYRRRTRRPLYRARSYRRKRYTARRSRALARYVKKVASSTAETKFITYFSNVATVPFNEFRVWNLVRAIPQGTSQNTMVGEQLFLKGFRIRIQLSNFGGTVTTTAQSEVVMALIWAKDPITTTTTTAAPANFQVVSNGVITIDRFDTDNTKFIKMWRFRIVPQSGSGQNVDKVIRTYIPINRHFRFQSGGSSYGKYGQYYLIAGLWTPGGTVGATVLQGAWNTTCYFKDA